jgi:ribonuclease P protein component
MSVLLNPMEVVKGNISNRKNRLPMLRLQKDIDELFAQPKSLVRSGNQTKTLSSMYYIRPLSENVEPILFLLHAPKKFIRQAHERNKVKRWMREAMRKDEEFKTIKELLLEKKLQVLLLIRADFKPSKDHGWQQIEEDIRIIVERISVKLR